MRVLIVACFVLGASITYCNPNYQWQAVRVEPLGADFLQEWVAGDMLLAGRGGEIYHLDTFDQWQHSPSRLGFVWATDRYYPAVYPPSYYCLIAPLALMPYWLAVYVWLAALLGLYCLSAWLCRYGLSSQAGNRCGSQQHPDASEARFWILWVLCLFLPAMFFSLIVGQKGALWLAVIAAAMILFQSQRPMSAGLVAGLLTLKPTLALVLPLVMVLRGQWRFGLGFALSATTLVALTLLLVPMSMWSDYVQVIMNSGSYQGHGGYRPGWSTSLLTLFQGIGLEGPWLVAAYSVSALALLSVLVDWRGKPWDQQRPQLVGQTRELAEPRLWFQLLSATALLSPHFYFYDLVWLLAPLALALPTCRCMVVVGTFLLWGATFYAQHTEQGWPGLSLVMLLLFVGSGRWPAIEHYCCEMMGARLGAMRSSS